MMIRTTKQIREMFNECESFEDFTNYDKQEWVCLDCLISWLGTQDFFYNDREEEQKEVIIKELRRRRGDL